MKKIVRIFYNKGENMSEKNKNEILNKIDAIIKEKANVEKLKEDSSHKRAELYNELNEINNNLESYPGDERSIWEDRREEIKLNISNMEKVVSQKKKAVETKIENVKRDVEIKLHEIDIRLNGDKDKEKDKVKDGLKNYKESINEAINTEKEKLKKEISKEISAQDDDRIQNITENIKQLKETLKKINEEAMKCIKARRKLTKILENLSYEKVENLKEEQEKITEKKSNEEEVIKKKVDTQKDNEEEKTTDTSVNIQKDNEEEKTTDTSVDMQKDASKEKDTIKKDNVYKPNIEKVSEENQVERQSDGDKSLIKVEGKSLWKKIAEKMKKFFSRDERNIRKLKKELIKNKKDQEFVKEVEAECKELSEKTRKSNEPDDEKRRNQNIAKIRAEKEVNAKAKYTPEDIRKSVDSAYNNWQKKIRVDTPKHVATPHSSGVVSNDSVKEEDEREE